MTLAAPALSQPAQVEPGAAPTPPELALEIEVPAEGGVVGPGSCGLFVAGHAGASSLDVVIVLDTSVSTADASGSDIDGDGQVGTPGFGRIGVTMGAMSSDAGDSILAAEVAAARRIARGLDPRRVRVGLVSFSGGPADLVRGVPILPNAVTRVPLTHDRAELERGLDALGAETPAGGTHMAAGIDQAIIELLGLEGAESTADPARARFVVLLTDGTPTLPHGPGHPAENVNATLRSADRAQRARVQVSVVALGSGALDHPVAAVELASRTGGGFIPVRQTGNLLPSVDEVAFSPSLEISLRNESTGKPARAVRTTPDGSWSGFVSLAPGANRIAVTARSAGGSEVRRGLEITLDPSAPPSEIPREYDFFATGGAFGDCLRKAKRVDLTAAELRREQVRRELVIEMEREREQARQRAAQQRKELEIEALPEPLP